MEIVSATIASIFFIIFIYVFFFKDQTSTKGLPPGPKPWPIVGNLLQLGEKPHAQFAELAETYGGDLFSLKLGSQTVVVASSPSAATQVLKTHDRILSGRYVFQSFRVEKHVNNSIVWSECNENWKMLRKVCRTEVFSSKMIESQAHLREAKAMDLVEFLKGREGQVVKITEVVFGTLINIFGRLIFSQDVFDLGDPTGGSAEMKDHIWQMLEMGNSANPADYFPFLGKFDLFGQRRAVANCLQQIYDVWGAMLRDRRRAAARRELELILTMTLLASCLMLAWMIKGSMLCSWYDSDSWNHSRESFLYELFAAGTETTSSTIEWAVAELTKNPTIKEKLRREMESVVGKERVKESDIPRLPYLQAFVKEILRLHPPTPMLLPRRALETCQVMGYTIPKDCQIMVNAWAIARDPKIWKDPLKFSPERFLDSSLDFKGNDFEFIPFGGGRRICPGIPLATQFIGIIVATLVQNLDWSLPNGMDPSELVMEEKFGLTLQKEPPLLIVPKSIEF
ncbi:hypothetical protein Syun_006083 [Stephania yunnanensis]|uniref:Cytochrome P450 n=1 Tax=Stephania yunnanensis TaxID=152371 RepID=A0AAP0PX78_9MAGN